MKKLSNAIYGLGYFSLLISIVPNLPDLPDHMFKRNSGWIVITQHLVKI